MIVYKATVCFILVICCPVHLLLTNFAGKIQSNEEKGNKEAILAFFKASLMLGYCKKTDIVDIHGCWESLRLDQFWECVFIFV